MLKILGKNQSSIIHSIKATDDMLGSETKEGEIMRGWFEAINEIDR